MTAPGQLLTSERRSTWSVRRTQHAEYVRQALLRCLEADGVKLTTPKGR